MAILPGLRPGSYAAAEDPGRRSHAIQVVHPGIHPSNTVDRTLVQRQYRDGRADDFCLEMDSVACGDAQCAVVTVRMVWDELGFYQRIETEPGVQLEKADGKPFSRADLKKLDRILCNRDTTIWKVSRKELVQYQDVNEAVDGATAATILPDKSQYVEGAVWTCYTLWHWANGSVPALIRDIKAAATTLDELYGYLSGADKAYRLFALEQLTVRKAYDPQSMSAVIRCASTDDYDLLWLLSDYAEQAETEMYFILLDKLFRSGNSKLRLICLDSLLTTEHIPPQACYEQWAAQLAASATYMELNRFITILEKKNGSSPAVLSQLMPLLDNDSFPVARRAYWFLNDQELPAANQARLAAFHERYADSL